MNLLIDIGNTRAKYVFEESGELSQVFHCDIDQLLSVCEQQDKLQKILLVSVSNQDLAIRVDQWAQTKFIEFQQIITEAERFGVKNSYVCPENMGTDKWLALIGGQARYPNKTLLIVDSGTATTIDIINHDKQHIGGWIIPGVNMMMTSLYSNTEKVKGDVERVTELGFGRNTSDNVNFGCWATTIGAVEQAMSLAEKENIKIDHAIFTGGNGQKIKELGKIEGIIIDDLIFVGLQQYL